MEDAKAALVLVGIDGSGSSLEALDWAGNYAAVTGASVELVATWEWPASYGWAIPLPEGFDPGADAQHVLSESAARVRDRHHSISVSTTVVEGHAAQILVEMSAAAALLVVGSRGHGQFAGMVIGSVSEYCAAHAQCPVLVFHREDKKDD